MRRPSERSVALAGPGLGSAQPPQFHAAQASSNGPEAWPGAPPACADQPKACVGCQVPSAVAD
eukprot:2432622-Alexandrium_andersonii.AAC.1